MLYLITTSKGKFTEVQQVIPNLQHLNIDLPEIQELNPKKIIEAKLQSACKYHSGEFIVEDTSLYLDCLNGLPGPLIKWFIKTIKNEGLAEIAEKFGNKKAAARTYIGYAKSREDIHFFEGEVKGKIVRSRGKHGFGWNPIFQPDGTNKTFGEMKLEEKQKFSMRRIVADKLKMFLNNKNI